MSTSSVDRPGGRSTHLAFAGVAVTVCTFYLTSGGVTQAVLYLVAALAPSAAIAWTLVQQRPHRAHPWWWALASTLCLALDALVWLVGALVPTAPAVLATVGQTAVLLGYGGLLVASVLLIYPAARDDGGKAIDSALISLGSAVLVWAFVVDPLLVGRDLAAHERVAPLVGLLLVAGITGALVRAVVAAQRDRATLGYLLGSAVLAIMANVSATVTDTGPGTEEDWISALWVLSYLALAAAAAHPHDLELLVGPRPRTQRLSRKHLVLLAVALTLNPLLATGRELAGHPLDLTLLSVGTLVLVPLVIARISQLARLQTLTEQELVHQATHDALTGLPNRRAADQHLKETVRRVTEDDLPGALLCFLDLDSFKDVNDEHGHHVGDRLLVVVAERLRTVVGADDFVARFGGDEFILIVVGDPDRLRSETVERVREALCAPVDLGPVTTSPAASIGTAGVRASNVLSGEQLTSIADARMYAEKRRETRAPSQPLA